MGTFKKYPAWTHWVKWGQIVSELTMNSQCTSWVSDPLPPVTGGNLAMTSSGTGADGGGTRAETAAIMSAAVAGIVAVVPAATG